MNRKAGQLSNRCGTSISNVPKASVPIVWVIIIGTCIFFFLKSYYWKASAHRLSKDRRQSKRRDNKCRIIRHCLKHLLPFSLCSILRLFYTLFNVIVSPIQLQVKFLTFVYTSCRRIQLGTNVVNHKIFRDLEYKTLPSWIIKYYFWINFIFFRFLDSWKLISFSNHSILLGIWEPYRTREWILYNHVVR